MNADAAAAADDDDDAPAAEDADAPLLARAAGGDVRAWGALLSRHERRLSAVATFRLDPRLRGRVDAADVVQDALTAATERREEFFEQSARPSPQPLFLWLRWMVANTLLGLHRHHLGARMRDARRERVVGLAGGGGGGDVNDARDHTRVALVAQLTAGVTGPATAAGRGEVKQRLHDALEQLEPTDREVLALRHFEQLTSGEAAQVLGIQERAAAKRYTRALERLREMLSEMPGGLTEVRP